MILSRKAPFRRGVRVTFGPSRNLGRAVAILAALFGGGCAPMEAPVIQSPLLKPEAIGSRIALVSASDRPTVAILVREGDPSPAVSLSAQGGADPEALAVLGRVIERRAESVPLKLRIDRGAISVSAFSSATTVGAHLKLFSKAFETPVDRSEIRDADLELLKALPRSPDALFDASFDCQGTWSVPSHLPRIERASALGRVEAERKRLVEAGAVTVGLVGDESFVKNGQAGVSEVVLTPRTEQSVKPVQSGVSVGTHRGLSDVSELTVAVARDALQARQVATELRGVNPLDALAARAHFTLTEVTSSSLRGRGCVAVRFRGAPATSGDPKRAAAIGHLARQAAEILAAPPAPPSGDEEPLEIVIARERDPRMASLLAAWWAQDRRETAETRFVTLDVPADLSGAVRAELKSALSAKPLSLPTRAPIQVIVERGQFETGVLVRARCALADEPARHWGRVAQALTASAPEGTALDVEPWWSSGSAGLYAHGSGRSAIELLDAAAEGFFRPLGPSDVLRARGEAGRQLTAHWPAGGIGLPELGRRVSASILEPWGQLGREQRFEADELRAALVELSDGPVEVVVRSPVPLEKAEEERLTARAHQWFPSSLSGTCAAPTFEPERIKSTHPSFAKGGRTSVALATFPLAGPGEIAIARVLATFLPAQVTPGDRGYLTLISTVAASESASAEAILDHKMTALKGLPDASLSEAIGLAEQLELARRTDPKVRLAEPRGAPITLAEVRKFIEKTLRPDRAIWISSEPRP